jgi:hypothetical protein
VGNLPVETLTNSPPFVWLAQASNPSFAVREEDDYFPASPNRGARFVAREIGEPLNSGAHGSARRSDRSSEQACPIQDHI